MHERFMKQLFLMIVGLVLVPIPSIIVALVFKSDALMFIVFAVSFGAYAYILSSDVRLPFAITWEEERRRLRELEETQDNGSSPKQVLLKAPPRKIQIQIALGVFAAIILVFLVPPLLESLT